MTVGSGAFGWLYFGQYAIAISSGIHGTATCTLPGFGMGGKTIAHLVTPYYGGYYLRKYRRYGNRSVYP